MAERRSPDAEWQPPDQTRVFPEPPRPRAFLGLTRRRGWVIILAGVLVIVSAMVAATLISATPGRQPASAHGPDEGSPASSAPQPEPASPSASSAPSQSPSPAPSAAPSHPAPVVHPNGPNCAARPSGCGLPDATNTGVPAGTHLTVITGDMAVKTPNTVIDSKDIRGCVEVDAPGVVIRRSKISCSNFTVIASSHFTGTPLRVEDSEVDCLKTPGTGMSDRDFIARRLNVHGCENGFDIVQDVTVTDTYIHDLNITADSHADGAQLSAGANITISHNTIMIKPGGNSAIISAREGNSAVTISDNLMAGGGYSLYCPRNSSSNFHVLNNRFSTAFWPKGGEYAAWTYCDQVTEARGNIWDNSLQPVHVE